MFDFGALRDVISGGRELAQYVGNKARDRSEPVHHEELRAINDALRQIYFAPRGVMLLIEMLSRGERPSFEQVESILPRFNDFEYNMNRYMRHFDSDDGRVRPTLTLKMQKNLRNVAYGKVSLRATIQVMLNEALTFDGEVPKKEAAKVLREVLALNAEIEDADEKLMQALGRA